MPFQEKIQIVKNNLVHLPLFIKTLYKTLYSSLTVTPSYLGGYYNEFTGVAKIKSVNERINIVFYNKGGEVLNYSLHNLYYLQKINDLCKQSNISLVLISTPLHSLHKDKIPVNYLKKHQEIVNKSNRHLLDYSNLLEDAKYFMPDGDHVNKRGSISTINIFKSQLNQILK
ncbi:hypothetical protein EGI11_07400 [Chryseobacterium sp. H3056]|uniref:SGNH/GDSL hydrolase family protein n=1 Tax=Kaistella daneshvariae TaxID=2487074 RepID=A0A3N0WVY1_9FLAO|nr:hypothetical protein EGI11_07400 [Kaistella daneshvariae]